MSGGARDDSRQGAGRRVAAGVSARGWGWRHAGRDDWAARGLDLEISHGERVLLLGASGSGKSTFMAGMAGVLGGDEDGEAEGELLVGGETPARARGRAGLVLQDPDAQVVLSRVGDDVAFGCENLGVERDEIWRRVPDALAAVGLGGGEGGGPGLALDRSTSELSGGQKQRLALAGALAMRPGLLLLDEPTAQLDPAGVIEVRDAVLSAVSATGATLVVVEHRLDAWVDHIDRVIVLGADGLIADGAPDEVFRDFAAELADAGVWVPTGGSADPARRVGTGPDAAAGAAAGPRAQPEHERSVRAGGAEEPLAVSTAAGSDRRPPFAEPGLLTATSLAVARGERIVAGGIDVRVRPGRAMAITGPNGAGKSTLALALAGLVPPASGAYAASPAIVGELPARTRWWRAERDTASPADWTSRELLTRIGAVFQSPEHQLIAATVRAELEVGPRALKLTAEETVARVDPLLDRLRLRQLEHANPFTLSGGEKRRLTVAAALATRPRVLVLDEPTFGQDARTWRELVDMLAVLRADGTALVLVTHDEPLVAALADDVLVLPAPGARTGAAGEHGRSGAASATDAAEARDEGADAAPSERVPRTGRGARSGHQGAETQSEGGPR